MSRVSRTALAAALAVSLAGGAAVVAAHAQPGADEAVRQARQDARKAERDARVAQIEARKAQHQARQARQKAHRVVVHRLGHDGDRAEHLRNLLQLRPNQEAALTAYLEAMAPKHDHLVSFEEGGARKSTPERLAEMEKQIAERVAASRARIEATRRFYAQLDDRQKKAFDELPLMMGPGHFGPLPMRPMKIMHELGPMLEGLPFPPEIMPPPPVPPVPPAPPAPPVPPAGV